MARPWPIGYVRLDKDQSMTYKISKIPKGNGKYRTLYIANRSTNETLRSYLPYLEEKLANLDETQANYAFLKNRNCVLNALQHIGFKYTLSFDLEDFFDSVSADHVSGIISSKVITDCFFDGAPRQGLPTSPLIATIAFLECDKQIVRALKKSNIECVYTRYADDLSISFNTFSNAGKIKFLIAQILSANKFKLNPKKSSFQCIKNGRIVITGIAIDENGLHPTRKTKKKIRAAVHQGNIASTRGLIEWSKCKLPKSWVTKDG